MEWIWGGCAAWETVSTLSGAGGGPVFNDDTINYTNACPRKIQAAIHYFNENGNWMVGGWFELNPGETKTVAKTRDKNYYLYAETIEPVATRQVWAGNDHFSPIAGQGSYGFFKRVVTLNQYGIWTQTFNCDKLTQFYAVAVAWNANGAWQARRANSVSDAQTLAVQACNANVGPGQICSIGATVTNGGPGCVALSSANGTLYSRKWRQTLSKPMQAPQTPVPPRIKAANWSTHFAIIFNRKTARAMAWAVSYYFLAAARFEEPLAFEARLVSSKRSALFVR